MFEFSSLSALQTISIFKMDPKSYQNKNTISLLLLFAFQYLYGFYLGFSSFLFPSVRLVVAIILDVLRYTKVHACSWDCLIMLHILDQLISSFLTNTRHYSLELRSLVWVALLAPHYTLQWRYSARAGDGESPPKRGLHLCNHLHCNRGAGAEPDRELSGRAGCIFLVTLQEALLMDPI